MVPRQVAQEAPVLVMLHPGQRHVGGGLDVCDIQPQGDMLQCGTLDLHESDRVAQPQRQVGGPALLSVKEDLVVRVGEDGEHVAALGSHQDGIALNAQHRAAHPVHEILLLLEIAGERDPHALINGNLQGLAVHELAGVVVVADVALVVARHIAKRGRVGVESLHGQVVQEGGAAASDGQEKGLRGLVEDVLHVQLGGFGTDAGPTIRHGPVPTEDAQQLLPVRLRSSKELQLPAQIRALAAPHGTQMPHHELLPTGAVARASAIHAGSHPGRSRRRRSALSHSRRSTV